MQILYVFAISTLNKAYSSLGESSLKHMGRFNCKCRLELYGHIQHYCRLRVVTQLHFFSQLSLPRLSAID